MATVHPTDVERVHDRERWWSIHDPDEYVCPDCGRSNDEHRHPWEVHHINREPGKIVGLCRACHRIRHGSKPADVDLEFWKESVSYMSL